MTYTLQSIHAFASRHDELPAFHVGYFVLTLFSAIALNLGIFGLLIVAHMCLDVYKYRFVHQLSWDMVLKGTVHESLIDVTLLFVALTFSVYIHHSTGMLAISGLLRAEVTLLHLIGTVLPKFFILEHVLKAFAHLQHYLQSVHKESIGGWTLKDAFYASAIVLCSTLLYVAPLTLQSSPGVVWEIIMWELHPLSF